MWLLRSWHRPDVPRDGSCYAFAASQSLPERAPPLGSAYPDQWVAAGPKPMGPEWIPLWQESCDQLAAALEELKVSQTATMCGVYGPCIPHACG